MALCLRVCLVVWMVFKSARCLACFSKLPDDFQIPVERRCFTVAISTHHDLGCTYVSNPHHGMTNSDLNQTECDTSKHGYITCFCSAATSAKECAEHILENYKNSKEGVPTTTCAKEFKALLEHLRATTTTASTIDVTRATKRPPSEKPTKRDPRIVEIEQRTAFKLLVTATCLMIVLSLQLIIINTCRRAHRRSHDQDELERLRALIARLTRKTQKRTSSAAVGKCSRKGTPTGARSAKRSGEKIEEKKTHGSQESVKKTKSAENSLESVGSKTSGSME
ncbi:hypothetical protein Q1695_004841 [Nippostrongylus brasiliensis]|nr:hypothetical protein Q1695_004841 [Nippostrongylus brasiliensis]